MNLTRGKLLFTLLFLLLASAAFAQQQQMADAEKTSLDEAEKFLDKGNFESAIFECNKVLLKNPKNVAALYLRGLAKFFKPDADGAMADLTKVIELAPKSAVIAEVYNVRGHLYFVKKDYEKAFADYDKAISIDPNMPEPYVGRANTLYYKGSFDKSLADYDKAIQMNSTLSGAYIGRSDIKFDRGDFDSALADLSTALEYKPDSAESYAKRGIIYGLQGKWSEAVTDLRKALELSAQSRAPYWKYLSVTFLDFDKYIQSQPTNANAYAVRGFINLLRGKTMESERDFKKSFELNARLKNDLDDFIRAVKETKQ